MKQSVKSNVEVRSLLNDAWLGIQVKENELFNPLATIPSVFENLPHIYITHLLSTPDYFSFICKEILNVQLLPFQAVILKRLFEHKFPMLIMNRGSGKSYLLGVYAWLRALLLPGRKIVIAGSTFRQSKIIFEYMEHIWKNSPILRDVCRPFHNSGPRHDTDMWRFFIGESIVSSIPIGSGEGIRGLRANDILSDEFKSHDRTIFETVIAGFGAVSANPVDNVQEAAKKKLAKELKIHVEDDDKNINVANQLVLSGTAYYQFNHFYEYFKRWKQIILSQGNKRNFETAFGAGSFSEDIDYRDYCIIRMPIELMPDGFMDQAQIARSRATMHSGNYNCEYGSVFSHDSNGFFKRSLIESCTVGVNKSITFPSCKNPIFHPTLVGNRECKYAIGVDPASEDDNFAINVIEIWPDHKRVVYNWTITKKEQKARLEEGDIQENDFFGYCARKIRSLMKNFNTCILGIDSQGGGYALMEALTRIDGLQPGELPIYEIIEPSDPKETDGKPGLHIIKKIQFADAKWVSESNNSLRLALEQKTLLFPFHDALTTEFAKVSDNSFNLLYDTLQDCIQEIEELKDELSTIIMTSTDSGRDKWTTPDKKEPGMKKGKMRKDRYTALLISHYVADFAIKEYADIRTYNTLGGFAIGEKTDTSGPSYSGPSWIAEKLDDLYD